MFKIKTDWITNPEAIALINKIQSGEIFRPLKEKFQKYKWFIIGTVVLLALFLAIAIGKQLSRQATPVFQPPSLGEGEAPTPSVRVRSSLDPVRKAIIDFSTTLPDPALPVVDNSLSLEQTLPD